MHCIEQFQGEGGDNEFADGFSVAEFIKNNYPKEWDILTTKKCTFSDIGYGLEMKTDFYKIREVPIIK